jgi:hypothetical protein
MRRSAVDRLSDEPDDEPPWSSARRVALVAAVLSTLADCSALRLTPGVRAL